MAKFKETLQNLKQGSAPSVKSLKFLSDLGSEDRATLREVWPTLPLDRRIRIVTTLVNIIEDNIDFDFRHVFLTALEDTDPHIRRSAIEGLVEDTSSLLLGRLLTMLRNDPDDYVREAVAIALARFTYLEECNKLTTPQGRLRSALIQSAGDKSEEEDVRRRAVESLGHYFGDAEIKQLIADEYRQSGHHAESAVLAMGRSMDNQWSPVILHELKNESAAMRYEAAHAAGEMSLEDAQPQLARLVDDDDTEVQLAAIWALGQIGGRLASDALNYVLQGKDTTLHEAAQDALQEIGLSSHPLSPI